MDGIITSQLGYLPDCHKRFLLCMEEEAREAPPFVLWNAEGQAVHHDVFQYWGAKWGRHYWVYDFETPLPEGGYYVESDLLKSGIFEVRAHIFKETTYDQMTGEQLAARVGGKQGWQDCGSDLRAVEGNAIQTLGLLDCWEAFADRSLTDSIRWGADYLLLCQREDGSFVNEYYHEGRRRSLTLCALAVLALARANRALDDVRYLRAAQKGWAYLRQHEGYTRKERLSEIADTRKIYGQYAPWLPPEGLRVRDKLLQLRCGMALYTCTNDVTYKDVVLRLAEEICRTHQNLEVSASGLWGNYYAWAGSSIFQRAWEHMGWGYNCGAVLPDDVGGLVECCEMFPEEDLWLEVRYALHQYVYGYFLPAAEQSPFHIYPLGMVENGELLFFGPAWHGFNGMYGLAAKNAMRLARLFDEPALVAVALDNMQFVAGQNPLALDDHIGISFINGIGEIQPPFWSDIPRAIANGISASPQFQTVHADDVEDAPAYYTSEDWIVHSGGWLSGLSGIEAPSRLKIKTLYKGRPISTEAEIQGQIRQTDAKGLLRLEWTGPFADVMLCYHDQKRSCRLPVIPGNQSELICDFAQWFTASFTWEADACRLQVEQEGLCPGEVQVAAQCVGAKLTQDTWTLPEGGDLLLRWTEEDGRPLYLRVEIAGRYAAAVCESTRPAQGALCGEEAGAAPH